MNTATATKTRRPARTRKPAQPAPVAWPVTLQLFGEHVAAVRAVALAASKDEGRGVLTSLRFVGDGLTLTITGCDGYRVHVAELDAETPVFDAMIPAAWLMKSLRDVKPSSGLPAVLELTESHATISNHVETRSTRRMVGDYPGTAALIEKYETDQHDPDAVIGCNPDFLAHILKACSMIGGDTAAARFSVPEHRHHPLRFDIRSGTTRFYGLLMPLRLPED